MNSLFEHAHNDSYAQRFSSLNSARLPTWGTMSCSQMMSHCSKVILFAAGEIPVVSNKQFPEAFYRKAKMRLCSDQQLEQNLPSFEEVFAMPGVYDFEQERAQLFKLLNRIRNEQIAFYKNNRHPYFGEMSAADWDRLQVKHLEHHLKQFSA